MEKRNKILVICISSALVISFIVFFPIESIEAVDAYAEFYPTDDAYILHRSGYTNVNRGGFEIMEVENYYGASGIWGEDTLIKFDISSVPSNTKIISAKLNLYYHTYQTNNPAGRDLNIYRINSDWDELTVTWDTKPAYAGSPTSFAEVPSTTGVWMSWDVTNDVQDFVDGININYGWKISDDTYWGTVNIPVTSFRTKEYGDYIPYLEIEIADIYVDDDADPDWYDATHVKTIQEGINNASAGNTVFVYNGTYYENVDITKDKIKLIGEDKTSTIIDADNSGHGIYVGIKSHNMVISNFTIRNANGCGIIFHDPISKTHVQYNTISDCIVYNTKVNSDYKSGVGILLGGHDSQMYDNVIKNCTIYNNDATGIRIIRSAYAYINNNQIIGCKVYQNGFNGWYDETARAGIAINIHSTHMTNTIISDCEIYDNAEDGIYHKNYAYNMEITNNTIYNNPGIGINITGTSNTITIYHNKLINNGQNANDVGSNTWDNGYPSGGNYWSDYSGVDSDNDGIGDTPYLIPSGSSQDRYPLGYFKEPPIADFTYTLSSPINTDIIEFIDTSTDSDGTLVSWWWNFGDGYYSDLQNPIHVYYSIGTYDVTLTVTDNDDASDTKTVSIEVRSPSQEVETLIEDIYDMELHQGLENSLIQKLMNVLQSIGYGWIDDAINQLNAFINQVEGQRGNKLTDEQADYLVSAAQAIIDSL